jgi:tetratricopeptide (TPR) repeat protein
MASNLEGLIKQLSAALRQKDAAVINEKRAQLGDQHPDSDAGAEANFRLGISGLMAGQDLEEAIKRLRKASKAKHPIWTPQARLSLGLLLKAQGKEQQAIFELRKVAGAKTASLSAAQALGFMVMMQEDSGNKEEASRTRKQHHDLLAKMVQSEDKEVASLAHYMLGMDHKYDGSRADAKMHLEKAIQCGGLQLEERSRVEEALTSL